MNTFYLIRHGQKISNLGNKPLTQVGVRQAEATGDYFKDKKIAAIYSSSTKRTTQTGTIIAKKLNLDIKIDDRLIERMNWDNESEETWEEFMNEWNKRDLDRDYASNRGISAKQCGERIEQFINETNKLFSNENILLISHGGTIGDLLRNNFDEKELPLVIHPKSKVEFLDILECSITIVEVRNDKLKLIQTGNIDHLPTPTN